MKGFFKSARNTYQAQDDYHKDDFDWDMNDDYEAYDGAADTEDYYEPEEDGEDYYESIEDGEETIGYYEGAEAEGEATQYDEAEEVGPEAVEYYTAEDVEEVEYYAEDAVMADAEYYAEDEFAVGDEAYYGEEELAGEEGYYAEDGTYVTYEDEAEEYYEQQEVTKRSEILRPAPYTDFGGEQDNIFTRLREKIKDMETFDKVVAGTGAAVLLLALVVGGLFLNARSVDGQIAEFAQVGSQLDGIEMIGEKGLVAIADAEQAKLAAAELVEENEGYNEAEYDDEVTIKLNMTSVMKDLKIKFTNKETGKLVANVPFNVTITNPSGATETWTDDDMDGIIYKKNITAGDYEVEVNALANARYEKYILPTTTQSVEVKKEIVYEKIDVSDEVKTEAEIDVSKEDTKVEVVVESSLTDTVEWVESTAVATTYTEVAKNTIPDPKTLVVKTAFMRMAAVSDNDPVPPADPVVNQPFTITPSATGATIGVGKQATINITASGNNGVPFTYATASDNSNVATALINADGVLTITGMSAGSAKITVTADYATGNSAPANYLLLDVVVYDKRTITLDKTAATVYVGEPYVLNATITDDTPSVVMTATSSDANVATVAVNARAITVTGVKEGTTTVNVVYNEGGEEITASCAITVKKNPREDKDTLLKDSAGNQLYVLENTTYREAVYADYYTATQFFVKGEAKYTGWQTIDGKVYYFKADGQKVTGEQIIQGAKYNFASDGSLVTGTGTMGIDVSKWNGTIDWEAVKNSGVSYVIIRCGYRGSSKGMLVEDPKFTSNIKGAIAAGLKVGVYFFSQAIDEVEAVEEASYVLSKIKNYKISYPVFLDVEPSGGRADKIDKATRTAVCKAFCETIRKEGYTAGIYANKTWLNEKMDAGALSAYKIWLAQYAAEPTYAGRYDMWQYKATGKVSGISGDVDLNLSYLGY